MALTLVFKKTRAILDTLVLDASVSETHSQEIEVTDHPVEQGANITDHRRRKPFVLTMEGIITNTPLPVESAAKSTQTYDGKSWTSRASAVPGRAEDAYATLQALCDSSKLLTITTALKVYPNMTLTSLSVPRDASTGQSLRFHATLREIRIVKNVTANIQAKTPRAKPAVDLHKKPAPPASPAQENQSLARAGAKAAKQHVGEIIDWVKGLVGSGSAP